MDSLNDPMSAEWELPKPSGPLWGKGSRVGVDIGDGAVAVMRVSDIEGVPDGRSPMVVTLVPNVHTPEEILVTEFGKWDLRLVGFNRDSVCNMAKGCVDALRAAGYQVG